MSEDNVINDVRDAKAWVDGQWSTFDQLGAQLKEIERAFRDWSGEFANVPTARSQEVEQAIGQAADEPGSDLLGETRPRRTG